MSNQIFSILKKAAANNEIRINEALIDDTVIDVYHMSNGTSQLRSEDGQWQETSFTVDNLIDTWSVEYNNGILSTEWQTKLVEALEENCPRQAFSEDCNSLQVHIGDKNSEGDWDETHFEFNGDL